MVRWLDQTGLYQRKIEEIVVFASHDVGESGQIGDNGSVAILTIESHHGPAE